MAHFAEINKKNIVVRVLVTASDDPNGDKGYSWLVKNLGGTWIETSYNGSIRKNYAGIGHTYNLEIDAFVSPQPFKSWLLDNEAIWQSPKPYPKDDKKHSWNEPTLSWVEITGE